MPVILLLFLVVFLLNLIPAFAPPTWMVFSFIGARYPGRNVAVMALAGALAATLGRVILAKMSRVIIRQRFLSDKTKENIDAIREHLEHRRKLTFGIILFYAFTPLPSNYVFIAYGLTAMELKLIAIPFFIGRAVSYSFWTVTASAVARRLSFDFDNGLSYLSVYFILSQLVLLSLIYAFTRVDWPALFNEKKLRWASKERNRRGN